MGEVKGPAQSNGASAAEGTFSDFINVMEHLLQARASGAGKRVSHDSRSRNVRSGAQSLK